MHAPERIRSGQEIRDAHFHASAPAGNHDGFLFCDRIAPGFGMKPVLFREKKILRPSPFMVSRFSLLKTISLVSYLVKALKSIYAVYPAITFVQDIN